MFYKKKLSFYDSTFPYVWVCFFTWWVDRLLVELGHRRTDSEFCVHNNLQYIHWHQYVTTLLIVFQIIKTLLKRRNEYRREAALSNSKFGCIIPVYMVQIILVLSWSSILLVLVDVSPWLCLGFFRRNRAIIAATALLCILCVLPAESLFWDWSLARGILLETI